MLVPPCWSTSTVFPDKPTDVHALHLLLNYVYRESIFCCRTIDADDECTLPRWPR